MDEYRKTLHEATQKAHKRALHFGSADSSHRYYAEGIADGLQLAMDLLRRHAPKDSTKKGER